MEENNKLEILEESNNIDVLINVLETFMSEATDIAVKIMNSDVVQDAADNWRLTSQVKLIKLQKY